MYVRPVVDGKVLSFGVSGKLWKDALIMYDRETDSLWSHVTGTAVKGKLAGKRLKLFPAIHTTWAEWKQLYPGSLVLTKESTLGYEGTRNVYESYFANEGQLGIFGTENPDKSLPGKEFVLGLTLDKVAVAYPYRHLSRKPLVNDVVAGQPLVVAFSAGSATGVAFSRRVASRTLTFTSLRRERGELLMDDVETKSTWQALSGEAIRGRLARSRLDQLPSTVGFWFAWKGFYPETLVWKP
ncbi:MAG: DUF3179 domain-containing protein [candidate division NC10 bacterium]|nr:DUF3179 domain-containing protein [candidate division NC10 bacterium]MBI2114725.1 DUF3179 domain-containing protein [candidate division NC10 bacterium]MBI2457203.1 DUF3179 domain-containing protein [candidate division NC10 bacterium]MBI3085288.1 DUF3179 domain-containing protein [candidate division NC10 bacterium]MBI3121221.1 DUF3179 domain-containing protein [candidate division NC10 bacterium]